MGPAKQESRNRNKLRRLGRLGLQLFTTFLGKARGSIAERRSDILRGRSANDRPDKGFTGCPHENRCRLCGPHRWPECANFRGSFERECPQLGVWGFRNSSGPVSQKRRSRSSQQMQSADKANQKLDGLRRASSLVSAIASRLELRIHCDHCSTNLILSVCVYI